MQVILTEDVVGVGDIGETVTVKPGYARNFLIPRGVAIETASSSAKQIAHVSRQIEAKKRRLKGAAEERGRELAARTVEFTLRVGSGGKVFGSVGNRDIAAALSAQGIEIDRRRVLLSEPIRSIGDHSVRVKLHAEVTVPLTVRVTKAQATEGEEQEETDEARAELEAAAAERAEGAEGEDEAAALEGETEEQSEE